MNAFTATARVRYVGIRLTMATLYDIKRGDAIQGLEHIGPVKDVGVTTDGYKNAVVTGRYGKALLELPTFITVAR